MGKDLLPELPVARTQSIYCQADGRYSVKNKFRRLPGELPNGDQYYGFGETDALKIVNARRPGYPFSG